MNAKAVFGVVFYVVVYAYAVVGENGLAVVINETDDGIVQSGSGVRRYLEDVSTQTSASTEASTDASTETSTDSTAHEEEEFEENLLATIVYFFFIYLFASLIGLVLLALAVVLPFQMPISVVWFLFGALLYVISQHTRYGLLARGISILGHVPSDIIYMVFLPVLLYEGAVATSWHKFVKMLPSSLILAYGGVALTSCVLAGLFYVTFKAVDHIWEALLLGSSLASTDPVAVISVLKSLKTPEKMTSMFEGESLLNDGTSVAFFQLFRVFVHGESISAGEIVWLTIRLMFLGPFFGGAWSAAACFVVQHFYGQQVFQTMFLLANMYFTFFVAEHYLGLSGPLAAVAFGLYIGARWSRHLSAKSMESHHHVVSSMAAFAESAIFIISGNAALRAASDISLGGRGWLDSFIVYLYMNCARTLLFVLLFPFLRRSIYSVNWRELIILIWGGLRGAIVLSLALTIEDEILTPAEVAAGAGGYDQDFGEFATFVICISTVFILGINGTLFQPIFQLLNPYPPSAFRRVNVSRVMTHIDEVYESRIEEAFAGWWLLEVPLIDVLSISKKLVPQLSWRSLNKHGQLSLTRPKMQPVLELLRKELKSAKLQEGGPDEGGPRSARMRSELSRDFKSNVDESFVTKSVLESNSNLISRRITALPRNQSNIGFASYLTLINAGEVGANKGGFNAAASDVSSDESNWQSLNYARKKRPVVDQASDGGGDTDGLKVDRKLSHQNTMRDMRELITMNTTLPEAEVAKLRKERVTEIQIMICNALRNRYYEFAENDVISGRSLAMLEKTSNAAVDVALALQSDGKKQWRDVLKLYPGLYADLAVKKERDTELSVSSVAEMDPDGGCLLENAFEVEWLTLRQTLKTYVSENSAWRYFFAVFPPRLRNHIYTRHVEADLHALLAFIAAHEDLLEQGGDELQQLLVGSMLESYKSQVEHARKQVLLLRDKYVEPFHFNIVRFAGMLLIGLKIAIVEEHSTSGVLLKEDKETIVENVLERQRQPLRTWNNLDVISLFNFCSRSNCCGGGDGGGVDVTTPKVVGDVESSSS